MIAVAPDWLMTWWRRKPRTLVVKNVENEDDTMWRAVRLEGDGRLTIEGHDLGRDVREFFGCNEYEFTRSFSKRETAALRGLLGVDRRADLLATIGERFAETKDLERFAESHGISGTFWSRTGD
jgi:hypothetical protein